MHGRRAAALALIVFVFVTCVDAAVLYRTRDRHLGVHEDHFDKGVALYETGSMSSGTQPMVFRPPGYPIFVWGTLALREAAMTMARPFAGDADLSGGRRIAALAAHAALLGALAAAVAAFAVRRAGTAVAVASAVAIGCNPLLLVLAGHVSYELLHLVLITVATLLLLRHAEGNELRGAAMFGNGLVWGLATLVKSVTLIVPGVIVLWSALHYPLRSAVKATAVFTLGLLLVVAPYTARNYAVTGRFIPVNEQASFALWGTSLQRIPAGADYLHWVTMWFESAMPTYTEITGATDYSLAVFEDHALEMSDRFWQLTAENFRRDPMVYAYNVQHNAVMFVVDQPTSYYFGRYPWAQPSGTARRAADLSVTLLTVIGTIGILIGSLRRDRRWTLILALFAMMWAAHALTFLEARYLYVKLPTTIAAFALACVVMSERRWHWSAGLAASAAALSFIGLLAL